MTAKQRAAIVARVAFAAFPADDGRSTATVGHVLQTAGFFDLLEAAEEVEAVDGVTGGGWTRLRDAIRRVNGTPESAEVLRKRFGFAAVDREVQDETLAENADGLSEEGK